MREVFYTHIVACNYKHEICSYRITANVLKDQVRELQDLLAMMQLHCEAGHHSYEANSFTDCSDVDHGILADG